jgi:hypothetical protein
LPPFSEATFGSFFVFYKDSLAVCAVAAGLIQQYT